MQLGFLESRLDLRLFDNPAELNRGQTHSAARLFAYFARGVAGSGGSPSVRALVLVERVTVWIECSILKELRLELEVMTVIELPDDQAAALAVKASAQGLSLEEWFKKLAMDEPLKSSRPTPCVDNRPIWEIVTEQVKDIPDEVFDKLPKDGASQVDHYIYGLPKRDE